MRREVDTGNVIGTSFDHLHLYTKGLKTLVGGRLISLYRSPNTLGVGLRSASL